MACYAAIQLEVYLFIVPLARMRCHGKHVHYTYVALLQHPFVQESKDANVSSKLGRCEVVIQERNFGCDMQFFQK